MTVAQLDFQADKAAVVFGFQDQLASTVSCKGKLKQWRKLAADALTPQ